MPSEVESRVLVRQDARTRAFRNGNAIFTLDGDAMPPKESRVFFIRQLRKRPYQRSKSKVENDAIFDPYVISYGLKNSLS